MLSVGIKFSMHDLVCEINHYLVPFVILFCFFYMAQNLDLLAGFNTIYYYHLLLSLLFRTILHMSFRERHVNEFLQLYTVYFPVPAVIHDSHLFGSLLCR